MKGERLRFGRLKKGWSQKQAAGRLGLSQPYLAMLEREQRRLTPNLARRARRVLGLPLTTLPLPHSLRTDLTPDASQVLGEELGGLGYPGFAYLRSRRRQKNPAEVLLTALAQRHLEARVVEALPWLLVQYPEMDRDWLVQKAKLLDLQNRLGFVATLARETTERMRARDESRVRALRDLGAALEQSRLARQDTLCRASLGPAEREWLRENQPEEARRWGLLTDWRVESLPYAG
jgi:transcriptional regulator with XRE-family HTH domain